MDSVKENCNIQFSDVADNLLILPKYTIDHLFSLEEPSDVVALYIFYYKTAKWQKTSKIKANNTYIMKSLKWGEHRVNKNKKILKELGFIEDVVDRESNKIKGHYIQIKYISDENSHTYCFERCGNSTACDLNGVQNSGQMLYINNKMLYNNNEMLYNNNEIQNIYMSDFEEFWKIYPKQRAGNKQKAFQSYCKVLKEGRCSKEDLFMSVQSYAKSEEVARGFAKGCAAWLNDDRFNNDYSYKKQETTQPTKEETPLDSINEQVLNTYLLPAYDYVIKRAGKLYSNLNLEGFTRYKDKAILNLHTLYKDWSAYLKLAHHKGESVTIKEAKGCYTPFELFLDAYLQYISDSATWCNLDEVELHPGDFSNTGMRYNKWLDNMKDNKCTTEQMFYGWTKFIRASDLVRLKAEYDRKQ